jgi:hypothetical protein
MNGRAGHPRFYIARLRAGMRRVACALGLVVSPIAAELRRLNRIGAGAGSRGERVRIVKQALAHRGNGPNRCC